MLRPLVLLFVLVPILELAILIQVGRWIGLLPTLGLIVATGIAGAALASREGLRAWGAFQQDLYEGRIPGRPIMDGLSIFAGGAMLLTPGVITDVLGFFLVLRPTRRWLQDRVVNRLGGSLVRHGRVYIGGRFGGASTPPGAGDGETGRPSGRQIERTDEE